MSGLIEMTPFMYLNKEGMYFMSNLGRVILGGSENILCIIHMFQMHTTCHI